MPTLSHFFCKWWIILINGNYKSAIELNYWILNHSVTNSVFQWHFLNWKKSFLHFKNILCFCSNVSKCALERNLTMQPQRIVPFKTQSAIFKNGSIFKIQCLKPLSSQTIHVPHVCCNSNGREVATDTPIYILEEHIHAPQFVRVH